MHASNRLARRQARNGYLFIALWFVGFAVFTLIPFAYTLFLSFTKFDLLSAPRFVGLDNYSYLVLHSVLFRQSILVTFRFLVTSVSCVLVFSLFFALLLNTNSRVMYVFRTALYVPSVVSGIAVAILWAWIFSKDFGLLNYVLSIFGIGGPNWMGDAHYAPWAFLIIMFTTFNGPPMVIYVAALQNIPKYLYEVSDIDGATSFQKFSKITLPMISPIILFNLITLMIAAFQVFVQAYTLGGNSGFPNHSLLLIVVYLYTTAFQDLQMGVASAVAWLLFVIVLLLSVIILRTSFSWVYYEERR